jgi:hypothetical protein
MRQADEERKLRKALAGSTTTQTFFSRAEADIGLESQGRHAAAAKATVVGKAPTPVYPRQPSGSPWAGDLVPPEGPTGYDINAMEPVGEPFEIEASLPAQPTTSLTSGGAEAPEVNAIPPQVLAPDCAIPLGSQSGALIRGRRL